MPDFELSADFDHDGTLTGSRTEYEAREVAPGALLPANDDADSRKLPRSVTPGPPVPLDYTKYTPSAADDEILPLRVLVNNPAALTSMQFGLSVSGISGQRVRLYDETGRILTTSSSSAQTVDHAVALAAPRVSLLIETRSYPGSPFGHASTLTPTFDNSEIEDEIQFTVELFGLDGKGVRTGLDKGIFSVPPVLFLDNGAHAYRLYIAEQPNNEASLSDLRQALRAIGGIELLTVGLQVSEDTWLQDQFHPGVVRGASGWLQAIIHMPRMRSNFVGLQAQQNLAAFVVGHFPSHNVGLMQDFWERTISFADATGTQHSISFTECAQLTIVMGRAYSALGYISEIALEAGLAFGWNAARWSSAREQLDTALATVTQKVASVTGSLSSEGAAVLQAQLSDARARVAVVSQTIPFNAANQSFQLPVGQGTVELTTPMVDELYVRITQMQGSANYGGNIASAPPTAEAPLGTIVIGNAVIKPEAPAEETEPEENQPAPTQPEEPPKGSYDHMDPDVLRFLYEQKQPVVEYDSTWLDVGHIDEMLIFVPDSNGSAQKFAALRASSGLAMKIIREAIAEYRSGLPANHPQQTDGPPSGVAERLTTAGTNPVTRLLRGKLWQQTYPVPSSSGSTPDILEPPRMYKGLSQAMNGGSPRSPQTQGINIYDIHFQPGAGPNRAYPADITVLELDWVEQDDSGNSVNDFLESEFLAPADEVTKQSFAGARIFPLPVVFDRVAGTESWSNYRWRFSTSAFTPDVVNMQVLNGHLLIPRPYGPRMRPANATAVLTRVLQEYDWGKPLAAQLNASFYQRAGLETTNCWLVRQSTLYRTTSASGTVSQLFGGLKNLQDVAAAFSDGFPGVPQKQIEARILQSNRGNFEATGELREGPRQFAIAEGTVDLFEAYIQLIAQALGLTVHWIDSWFYHVIFGGIHCATNVLREASSELPAWWSV